MTSFDYQKSTITQYRTGTSTDPYIDITETKRVVKGQIQLNEIPVLLNKVKINNMFEMPTSNKADLKVNEYRVDYVEGMLYFHSSAEGSTLTYTYRGRGNHFVSVDRIWTKEQDGRVVETLGDIISTGEDAIGNIKELVKLIGQTEVARDEAIEATGDANQATLEASTQAKYAEAVGDSLVHKGMYSDSTDYIVRNIIYYHGSTYMCINDTKGILPTDKTKWKKITNMIWKETYSPTLTYEFGDVVADSKKENIYMCISDGTLNVSLTTTENWSLMISVADAILNVDTQAIYAKKQGDFAKEQGEYSKTQGNYALEQGSDAKTQADNALAQSINAKTQAEYAKEQGDHASAQSSNALTNANYAKTQGDYAKTQGEFSSTQGEYAKAQGDFAKTESENSRNLVNKGTYDNSTTYKPLNIVVFGSGVWQCLKESKGNEPTAINYLYWQLLMQSVSSVTWDSVAGRPDVEGHIANQTNPHVVTAAQVGAYSKIESDGKYPLRADLSTHVLDNGIHVTIAKQNIWDSKETPSGSQAKVNALQTSIDTQITSIKTSLGDTTQIPMPLTDAFIGLSTSLNTEVTKLATHLADYTLQIPYAVTTGTANAYAISLPINALVAGMAVSVKINVASTGASTLNWNGKGAKGLKKADGTDITNLKAGVYTFRYDGTNFIVQGEGGEYGTAIANEVRSGKTIGTAESGLVTGTFSVASSDYPKDVSIFGVIGTLERMTPAERNAIIASIVAKGVAATAADSNVTLAAKIGQIQNGGSAKLSYSVLNKAVGDGIIGLSIFPFPVGTKRVSFIGNVSSSGTGNPYLQVRNGDANMRAGLGVGNGSFAHPNRQVDRDGNTIYPLALHVDFEARISRLIYSNNNSTIYASDTNLPTGYDTTVQQHLIIQTINTTNFSGATLDASLLGSIMYE